MRGPTMPGGKAAVCLHQFEQLQLVITHAHRKDTLSSSVRTLLFLVALAHAITLVAFSPNKADCCLA